MKGNRVIDVSSSGTLDRKRFEMRNKRFHGGKLAGGRMLAKAKDVLRDAPVLVAAAPINSRQSGNPTLPSELVPSGLRPRA